MRSKYRLTEHFVLAVLSRCLEETKFFAKEALGNLIKNKMYSWKVQMNQDFYQSIMSVRLSVSQSTNQSISQLIK